MTLKNLKNLSVIVLILFSVGCSTIELAHVKVGCEGQPQTNLNFTDEEAELITEAMLTKMVIFGTTLRQRIESQCEINKKHDKLFDN